MSKKINLGEKRLRKVLFFINDGVDDYIAARCLFMNNMPKQGAILSSTAIEKVFKAILAMNGNESHGHLKKAHWNKVKNFDKNSFSVINENFLKLNQKIYQMRYSDSLPTNFNIVIASREFLAELDHTFINYVSKLVFNEKSVFDSMCEINNPKINTENHVILNIKKQDFIYSREQIIFEFRMMQGNNPYQMNYCSDKAPKNESFLRNGFEANFESNEQMNVNLAFYPIPGSLQITLEKV